MIYPSSGRATDGGFPGWAGAGSGGLFAFADLEHRIGFAYVMNQFDATKSNADPRSVALSDEIYAALDVAPACT